MAEKYKCSFCGAEYDDPVSRAQCEIKCNEKQKLEAERIKKENLQKEKETRKESVRVAYQNFAELRDQYIKDYREPLTFQSTDEHGNANVTTFSYDFPDFLFKRLLF